MQLNKIKQNEEFQSTFMRESYYNSVNYKTSNNRYYRSEAYNDDSPDYHKKSVSFKGDESELSARDKI